MSAERYLVVNADDFGFTRDVNEGIIQAHREGILTATTLMANGSAFEDAVRLARQNPSLDVGCHLVLVGGPSLAQPGSSLPSTVTRLFAAVAAGRIPIYEELSAQVRRIIDAGLATTHLDTHKHTHLLPGVLEAVARIAEEFDIRWVRRPFDMPIGFGAPWTVRLTSRSLCIIRTRFHSILEQRGCRSTDHFAGFQLTGRLEPPEFVRLIERLPPGSTELMTHPGRCGMELRSASTRLKASRARELALLTAPETRSALDRADVRLVNYRDLAQQVRKTSSGLELHRSTESRATS